MSCGSPVRWPRLQLCYWAVGPKWEDYLLFTFAKLFIIHEHPYTFSRGLCCPLAAWLYITQDTPKWYILNSDQSLLHTQFPHLSLPSEAGSWSVFAPKLSDFSVYIHLPYPTRMSCGITRQCPTFYGRKAHRLGKKHGPAFSCQFWHH